MGNCVGFALLVYFFALFRRSRFLFIAAVSFAQPGFFPFEVAGFVYVYVCGFGVSFLFRLGFGSGSTVRLVLGVAVASPLGVGLVESPAFPVWVL